MPIACRSDAIHLENNQGTRRPVRLRTGRLGHRHVGVALAGLTLSSAVRPQSADLLPDLMRMSTALRPSLDASLTPLATSSGLLTVRPPTSRMISPDLIPFCAASELPSTSVMTTPSLLAPLAGAMLEPELIHLGRLRLRLLGSTLAATSLPLRELAEFDAPRSALSGRAKP